MENRHHKSFFEDYDKSVPVQTEFLGKGSGTGKLLVITESLCLYD